MRGLRSHRVSTFLSCAAVALALVVVPSDLAAEVDVPPVPPGEHYMLDRADLISESANAEIGRMQKRAAQQHDTQIVVVTIESKAAYGGHDISIEEFARQWFDAWGIGIRRNGTLYNKGMLLLVSEGDRKARIELGADWGHRWDGYCQRVMDNVIIPNFKDGDFTLGIVQGVDALTSMAERGPAAAPPKSSVAEQWIRQAKRWSQKLSIFPSSIQLALILVGLIMFAASFFVENETHSRWLFWGGIGLVVTAIGTYIVFAGVGAYADHRYGGSGDAGGFSGGGGFGGGFSGGGGATGGW